MRGLLLAGIVCLLMLGCSGPTLKKEKPPSRKLDLQVLLDQGENDSTITIPYGEYILTNGLILKNKKNLVLTAQPGTRILVKDTDAVVLSIMNSSNIRIENLYLRHVKPLDNYECHGAVMSTHKSQKIAVINCELNGCGAIGLNGQQTIGILIKHCRVHSNSFNAFYFESCSNVKIQSNLIENNGNLMQTYRTGNIEMRNNLIKNNTGYWNDKPEPAPGLLSETQN